MPRKSKTPCEDDRITQFSTIKVRLYPDTTQAELFEKTFGCCRYIWNQMLSDQQRFYAETGAHFIPTPAKYKNGAPFLKEVDNQALIQEHNKLSQAFRVFFKSPESFGYPNFKRKKDDRDSFTACNHVFESGPTIYTTRDGIRMTKAGIVRAKFHRRPQAWWKLKRITVEKNRTGKYYCYILYEHTAKPAEPVVPTPETTIALKYSIRHFYVADNGVKADPPRWLKQSQEKLARIQKKLNRMEPGSRNYQEAVQKYRLLHARVANQRRDFLHKESSRIANGWDAVCMRADEMQNLSKITTRGNVMESGFGTFREMLRYKLERQGKPLILVDRLNLQKEVSALKDEINRIADSANFNGIKLLDGELDGGGASTRAQITLPDVGRPIGDATVLKDGGVTPGETVFDVQLDTLAVNAKAGDKLTVQIGEDEFELTLEEKQYSAGDLATALKDAFDAGAKTIDGQAFEATVNGTSVNFKQVNKPTSADDTVSAMMDVKISFEAAAGGGPVVLAAGDGGVDAGTPAAIEGTAKSDIAVGAKKLDASGLDTDKILAALNGKTIADGTKVTIEKNADDKLELKVGNEVIGTSDEVVDSNSTSFTIKSADGNTTFGTITADSAPATADFTAALETGLSYKAAVEGTDPGPDAPGGDGDGEETPEVETVASSKLSVNGIDLADKTVTLTTQNLTDIGDEFAKLGSNTGKILISGEVEVDLSKVTDGLTGGTSKVEDLAKNMLEAAKAGADAWNKANPDKDYTTAADRIKQAGIGMSNMDNSAFTIGNENDTGKLTIDEAAGQTVYTSELYTKDGFEALFSANSVSPKTGNGLTLQIGDTSDTYNQLKVSVGDMHTTALGIEGVDISNQAGASKAIQTIKDAINRVSSVRGDLGAVQNRLEHTQNNLSVMAENIQDAESTIRDTDAAEEMMSYVKNNILVQSAQAMLAQANQLPQGGDPSIPQETPGSVSTTPAEKPTEPTPPANEQAATLYIGTKAGGFAEYPITYEGELTAEKLIQGIADLTGWDLTLAEEVTSGKGAEIPCRLSFLFF